VKEDKPAKKSQTELGVSNHVVAEANQAIYLAFTSTKHFSKHYRWTDI